MSEFRDLINNRRNLITLLLLVVMIIAIPISLKLVQQQQKVKSRASDAVHPITFPGATCGASGLCSINSNKVDVSIYSPYSSAVGVGAT